jgi:hypothetical protein
MNNSISYEISTDFLQDFCVQLRKQVCLFELRVTTPLRHFRNVNLSIISRQPFYASKISYMHMKRFNFELKFIFEKL